MRMTPYGFDGYQQMQQPGYFNTNYRPPMQPMQPAQPQPMTNVSWIYVNGLSGAREHIVQPGQTAWMMDNNDPIIYVKAVDNMGGANLRAFALQEIQPGAQAQEQPQAVQIDTSNFATREDIQRIEGKVDRLIADFGGVNA